MLKRKLRLFATCVGLFAIAFTAERIFFFIKYYRYFDGLDFFSVTRAFASGVRYDLSVAGMFTCPFMLAFFIPGFSGRRGLVRATLFIVLAVQSALLIYNFIDIEYYAFVNRHITFELANTWGDADMILVIGFHKYMPEIAGFLLFLSGYCIVFVKAVFGVARRFREAPNVADAKSPVGDIAGVMAMAALTVVFIRGGVQNYPLTVRHAFVNQRVEIGMLGLNGVYTTVRYTYKKWKKNRGAFMTELGPPSRSFGQMARTIVDPVKESADPDYPLYRSYRYSPSETKPYNVVVFLMESWSSKYVGALGASVSATPFFDKLSGEGLLLTDFMASGQRSIEALSALLGSFPSFGGLALGEQGYLYQTRFETAGGIFQKQGYDTMFIHGTEPGILDIDQLTKRMGFPWLISRDSFLVGGEIKDRLWGIGIYDEYLFMKAHEQFEKQSRPFFAVVFSLTSHTPYIVPSVKFRHFSESTPHHEFLDSMRYSDYALGRYFERARKSDYFRNTLYVIMADHTEGASTSDNLYENHWIPCLIYAPGLVEPGRYDRLASQVDIVPTIMDILRMTAKHNSWGVSIFNRGDRRALLSRGDMSLYMKGPYMMLMDYQGPSSIYNYRENPGVELDSADPEVKGLKEKLFDDALDYVKFSFGLIANNKVKPPVAAEPKR